MAKVLKGIGVVPGIAIGKAKILSMDISGQLSRYAAGSPASEAERFLAALAEADREVQQIIDAAAKRGEDKQAAIMDAHLAMLRDPELRETILKKINNAVPAPQAVLEAAQEYAAVFAALDDAYIRERAADVLDIGKRVARILLNIREAPIGSEPVILCAPDLAPSMLANMPPGVVQGLVLVHGSATSHVVIIAKARGLATVAGVPNLEGLEDGIEVVVDGTRGEAIIAPGREELAIYLARMEKERERYLEDLANASLPAATIDGRRVQLAANIGSPQDMDQAVKFGGEGVGLYRTEFLFMERTSFPTEEEQFQAYRAVAEKCGDHLCIIRTLDIGGDKPLPYLDIGQEANPFLGWRAIRISLDRPDMFIVQLKAILRAGAYGKVAVMLPMVISADEIRRARECVAQAAAELEREGKAFARNMPLGIMVETPAAAITAAQLAKECDFFSLGTNDLVQYTLCVDRGNQKVQKLYNHFHPAVLRLINSVIQAAHDNGIWAGICGEMASDPLAAALLVGLGVDELSVNAAAIPRIKERIRALEAAAARSLAEKILAADDAGQVRDYLAKSLGQV